MHHPSGPADHESAGPDPVEIRVAVVQTAIALFRRSAFHEVTSARIAAVADLDHDAVTAQFPTWDHLLVATIELWNAQRMRPLLPIAAEQGAVAFLRAIVRANAEDPALMRVLIATVNIAATPDHPMAPFLRAEWRRFHELIERTLEHDVAVGREPATMVPSRGAEQIVAVYEGMQLQSMLRGDLDVVEAFDRAVGRLRQGWSQEYRTAVWQL